MRLDSPVYAPSRFVAEGAATAALQDLAGSAEHHAAGGVVTSFVLASHVKWLLSGWACEMRALPDGRRQILGFALPGDPLQTAPPRAGGGFVAIALTDVACVEAQRLAELDRPGLQAALDAARGQAVARRYDAILRLGRMSALERVADLLWELHERLDRIGLVQGGEFALPITQEHLADALGLSAVHVNRSLGTLRERGLASFRFGRVTRFNRQAMAALCLAAGRDIVSKT